MAGAAGAWASLVRDAWGRRGVAGRILWSLLLPWSGAFRVVTGVRNLLYDLRWLDTRRLPLPVVSVGNLTVGGTGKTPTGLWLAQNLRRRGLNAVILSRGYGGGRRDVQPVTISFENIGTWMDEPAGELLQYGDEPVMLSALYGQTVGVGADRHRTGMELSRSSRDTHLFLLDDGFQYRNLEREVDLVLLGVDCGGSMLPAGPFRESMRALRRADILMVTDAHDRWRGILQGRFDSSRIFFASLEPRSLLCRMDRGLGKLPLSDLTGTRVLAVSAIARPERFYDLLRECGATLVETLDFPDHHRYSERDWREINRTRNRIDRIVTTEKDFVKLARFPFASGRLVALRVEMSIDRPEALLDRITEVVRRGRVTRPPST